MLILVATYSIRRSRMAVRHADRSIQQVYTLILLKSLLGSPLFLNYRK